MKTLGDVGAGHTLGRYELLLPIASGGMATVWAARLRGTRGFQKIVAIKTMLAELSDDPQFEQMFLDEAGLASNIKHPHVVEILDLGEEKGVLYLVMEWIDGEPLSVLMREAAKKGKSVPLPIAMRFMLQALAGLHAAHEVKDPDGKLVGLVHRDVSPQNLLVSYGGVVKVVDWGVAKAAGRGSATHAGQVKGKAPYMSPEQAQGHDVDRRTDVFAMGIILYQLATGKHPFRAETDVATLFNICADEPPAPPRKVRPDLPMALERVVLRALAKKPEKRYATAGEMLRELEGALPASLRGATDDDAGGFVRGLLSERMARRQEALKGSLVVADERAAGRTIEGLVASALENVQPPTGATPVSGLSERISHSGGFAAMAAAAARLAPTSDRAPTTAGTPLSVRASRPELTPPVLSTGSVAATSSGPRASFPGPTGAAPGRSPLAVVAMVGGALAFAAVAAAVAFVAFGRRGAAVAAPAAAGPASAAVVSAPAAPAVAETAPTAAPPTGTGTATAAATTVPIESLPEARHATGGPVRPREKASAAPPEAKPPDKPTAETPPAPTRKPGNLPPVKDPGF